MNDENVSAQAEGEVLPEFAAKPVSATDNARAQVAVDAWYATHFHAAAVSGRAPITAEEKASLIQHVAEALTPKE